MYWDPSTEQGYRAQVPNSLRFGINCNPSDELTAPCATGTSNEASKILKDTSRLLLCAQASKDVVAPFISSVGGGRNVNAIATRVSKQYSMSIL